MQCTRHVIHQHLWPLIPLEMTPLLSPLVVTTSFSVAYLATVNLDRRLTLMCLAIFQVLLYRHLHWSLLSLLQLLLYLLLLLVRLLPHWILSMVVLVCLGLLWHFLHFLLLALLNQECLTSGFAAFLRILLFYFFWLREYIECKSIVTFIE